ncbi:MAG: TRAP transporter fused permease subunit [Pseudomonadota bacterium]
MVDRSGFSEAAAHLAPKLSESSPRWSKAMTLWAALVALIHVLLNTMLLLPDLWVGVFHFASLGVLALCWLDQRISAWRLLFSLVLVAACSAVVFLETPLYQRGLDFSLADWVVCLLLVGLAIELSRRAAGWLIPALVLILLSYAAFWGDRLSGVFAFPGLSLETLLFRAVFTSEGLFGGIARISWSFVFMFVLFGAFLLRSGAGEVILELARRLAGRLTGGPGLVAVTSSGLMGSITGSAVANTASTGVITSPLMKRAGFPARFAGGVEAAASTGGQLMPPVMGAGAFLMANFTGLSYLTIVAAAFLPAVLYFLSLAFFVRLRAGRLGLVPESGSAAPEASGAKALKRQWPLLLPLLSLVAMLVAGFTPVYAAGFAIVSVVLASWLTPQRMGWVAIVEALALGSKNMVKTAMLLIAVGLIVNVMTTTGLGNTLSIMIGQWAGSSLILALLLVALASLVLGMGLPVTAAYIVLAAVSAPTLHGLMIQNELIQMLASGAITEQAREAVLLATPGAQGLGQVMSLDAAQALVTAMTPELQRAAADALLDPSVMTGTLLAAHLIIFWFSQDSNVTPPVALAAFTAAGIAGERPMATGLTAWKLAKGLYIIPLLFAYTPLVRGSWLEALEVAVFALIGLYALSAVFEGWLEGPLNALSRLLLAVCALLLLMPTGSLLVSLSAVAVVCALMVWSARRRHSDGS